MCNVAQEHLLSYTPTEKQRDDQRGGRENYLEGSTRVSAEWIITHSSCVYVCINTYIYIRTHIRLLLQLFCFALGWWVDGVCIQHSVAARVLVKKEKEI